jgi:hypothetical protein
MAILSGTLGGQALLAGQEAKPYSCAAPAVAVAFTVSFCNKTTGPVRVRLAHGPGATTATAGTLYWEYDTVIQPNEVLERTGLAMSAGRSVFAQSDTAGVDISIYGFEKQ